MKYTKLLTGLILILIFILGCSKQETVEQEVISEGKNFVEVDKVIQKDIEEIITYSGKLKAYKSAYVAPEISIKVKEFVVDEGDQVTKGQLLALMDDTQLAQAKAQYDFAKKNYERILKLSNSGSMDKQTFDQTESAYLTAKAAYEYMKKNTEILAPIDGVVTMKMKKEGESFSPMMTPALMRIVNLDVLKMKFDISDVDINKIKTGQKAYIHVDSEPGKTFIGKVTFVSPEADVLSGTFPCEITIQNNDHALKPNQYAVADIVTEISPGTIVIPKTALLNDSFIYVVNNGIAQKKQVETGLSNELEVEIIKGLQPGNTVIISGGIGLKDGSEVHITNR
ncbi:MAG TPA: efflux RND transporter periplasmic adaptor subunit [Candidatus Cloacimonetes bacterium]|nr:efflux RND transporter periplasmic adaptor subunit [Candidatus Cloacimonadota bacterium]HEX37264.1 efflux RND transporter periplasmic adaptor subunit [Candidatus Cloacimonadota bacterium]